MPNYDQTLGLPIDEPENPGEFHVGITETFVTAVAATADMPSKLSISFEIDGVKVPAGSSGSDDDQMFCSFPLQGDRPNFFLDSSRVTARVIPPETPIGTARIVVDILLENGLIPLPKGTDKNAEANPLIDAKN
jgi:hypothetical protein